MFTSLIINFPAYYHIVESIADTGETICLIITVQGHISYKIHTCMPGEMAKRLALELSPVGRKHWGVPGNRGWKFMLSNEGCSK